ncbi:MAG: glycogen/starch synthase [Paramuribaculum sp.]|nr:glycogen/starch synthase [Paramuribaculum sp.]
MKNNKILFISQEISPYLPQTPLADLGRTTPHVMQARGFEVRTFTPKYGCINERRNQLHEVIRLSGMNIIIDDSDHPLIIKVATLQPTRMQVYFIDNDDYFHHSLPSPEKELETVSHPADNDERMIFFVRGVIETVKKLRWDPAVIHCTGWITALAPVYLKRMYAEDPSFLNSKIIYSLRSESFDGSLDPRFVEKLLPHFTKEDLKSLGDGPVDPIALHKIAIDYADAVIVASPDIPQELIDYANASGHPVLPYIEGEGADEALGEFYDSILKPGD